ncbi:flagellar hook-associated protein FlgK [Ferribacterium limneticum]|uniref:flagellar hook-associated protein FlgK n=1 Tax=Ferribacterium limneticum TaxID=76259 RepID=UPI001CF94316|nr:flagellar hook-associated protein FlgK [Ferribacterium limneticum]UCV27664.1 flagellar hook-associated protein FlgK [Ferribacterium limneticum]UCV31581.1 flagellar hook-associated protein FlgK [Ferribacterium limneticum]
MGSGLISIAMTGINAAQAGLLTTGNNISNLSTEGYTRQRTLQASNPSVMTGAGGIGQGVHVVTVERMFSQALTTQVLNAQTNVSALDTYYAQVSQIDNMLADKEAGLTPLMQKFFDAAQSVATNPSSISARQSMVSAAETMTTGYRSMYERLTEIEAGINSQVRDTVGQINTYSTQIADLNEKIISAGAIGGQPANDLYDKRDKLVADLNELVKVTVTSNTNGSYNVFVGSGQQLVVGSQVTMMSAEPASADRSRNVIGLVGPTGNIQELPESLISGGKLGGLLSFRSEALDASFNQLGLMATSFTQTFNAQHALGRDLLGNANGSANFVSEFFSVGTPDVIPNSKNATGSPTVSITLDPVTTNGTNYYSNLTASDYRLSFESGALTLTRLSDNTSWTGANVGAINTQLTTDPQGFSLDPAVGFVNGDSYLIQPTRDAARNFAISDKISADPRLIAAGLSEAVARGAAANTGTGSVSSVSYSAGFTTGSALSLSYNAGSLSGFPATGTVTVTAGATTNTYTMPSSVPYTAGATIAINGGGWSGVSLVLSGAPNNGDSFTLAAATGVEDGRNIVKLGNLQTQNTMLGANATYQDNYAAFVNDVGNKAASAEISSVAQTSLLNQAVAAREAVSGVNSDEEAAKLIEYQQAYQASAKVIEIASNLFDTLLSIGR